MILELSLLFLLGFNQEKSVSFEGRNRIGFLYSMKIKEQTRKQAAGCSKHSFEVADRTDEVSNHIYGKATLTKFELDFRRVFLYSLVIKPDRW